MLEATPWRRWGKNRTYFTDSNGEKVGWVDNETGEVTGQREGGETEIRHWLTTNNHPAEPTTSAAPEPAPQEPEAAPYQIPGAVCLAKAATLPPESAEPWLLGAAGEQAVAAALETLPHPWRAWHSIPLGDPDNPTGDIDHIVAGPTGIWTLNTKHHPGSTIFIKGDMTLVNRAAQQYVSGARRQAVDVAVRLSAAIGQPIQTTAGIVFVGADEVLIKFEPRDILISTRGQILDRVTGRRTRRFNETQLDAIAQAVQNPHTWR